MFPGDNSILEPPDSIPNSEVKQNRADDSVGLPPVKAGHRQGLFSSPSVYNAWRINFAGIAQQVEQLTCNQ